MMIASSVDPNMGKPLCAALCMDDNEDMARNVPAFGNGVVSSAAGREQFSGWRVTPLQIATPDFVFSRNGKPQWRGCEQECPFNGMEDPVKGHTLLERLWAKVPVLNVD